MIINPEHQALADRLVAAAAIDSEGIEFFDVLTEVVDAGLRAAVNVCALLARQLAEATRLPDARAGDATDDEKDDE